MLPSCLRVLITVSFSLWPPAKQLYVFLTSSMNTAGLASLILLDLNNLIMQIIFLINVKDESLNCDNVISGNKRKIKLCKALCPQYHPLIA